MYVKCKELGVVPSEYLRIEQHVNRKYGLDGWWTCVQFDDAVFSVGHFIESATTGLDKNNKPKLTVKQFFQQVQQKQHNPIPKQVARLKRGSVGTSVPKLKKAS